MANKDIPVIDFSQCSLDTATQDLEESSLKQTGEAICRAFHNVGFVYLKNHGIPEEKIAAGFQLMKRFVSLPEDVKQKYSRRENTAHGWIAMARESLNIERPHDLKESFIYLPQESKEFPDPNQDVSAFGDTMAEMFQMCHQLTSRILEALGRGLNLDDPHYFSKAHNSYNRPSLTALRTLHYPQIHDLSDLEPKQIRCGEHSDWGSITLLFQDQTGGLEVMSQGTFIEATPIPGTVLVNIGDLMQRWSGDHFKSTIHRVVFPDDKSISQQERNSMAFFANPDDECDIVTLQPQDGSVTAKPIKTRDYMDMKMKAALHY